MNADQKRTTISKPPSRYSEDIDLVQKKSSPIGETMNQIRKSLAWLGKPKKIKATKRGMKIFFAYENSNGLISKLKV